MYPKSISNLIDSFKMFPGIGEKTAERLVFSILDMDEENIEYFMWIQQIILAMAMRMMIIMEL